MSREEKRALRSLEGLPHPINLCPLPEWLPPGLAKKLIADGKISVEDVINGEQGEIIILNGVVVTEPGHAVAHPKTDWKRIGVWITIATFLIAAGRILWRAYKLSPPP